MTDVFVYIGTYDSVADATADYEELKELHREDLVGTYDVAVISKGDDGKVHVSKHEKPTQHGAWTGLVVGAIAGIIFPPSIIASGAVGAVAGGLIGHFWRGMSRSDMKDLGEVLDDGSASLVIVGESKLDEAVKHALKRAVKTYEKQVDADAKELRTDLDRVIEAQL